jgi:hypothetical protein
MNVKWYICSVLLVAVLGSTNPLEAARLAVSGAEVQSTYVVPAWQDVTNTNAPLVRYWHTAIWTGTEMIVFGGIGDPYRYLNDGARYNPSTDSWTSLPLTGARSARTLHTAVWTGSEMIVWGGAGEGDSKDARVD